MRIAGVDIGGTSIKVGIFEDGVLMLKTGTVTPFGDAKAVCSAIAQLLEGTGVSCVGVGTAGSINTTDGTVCASNLGWEYVPLRAMLTDALRLPVWLDNDAQAALMAEWRDGACKNAESALYLTLGTGIGGAMLLNGRPYRGRNHLGAEFGHMIINSRGPRCACGRRGCFELYASATALQRMSGGQTTRSVIQLAKAGDPKMTAVFDKYIRYLAMGLSNLIMAFDPEVIVLGGGISGAGSFLESRCSRALKQLFDQTTDPLLCSVRIARHRNDAGIIGAALLAEQAFMQKTHTQA